MQQAKGRLALKTDFSPYSQQCPETIQNLLHWFARNDSGVNVIPTGKLPYFKRLPTNGCLSINKSQDYGLSENLDAKLNFKTFYKCVSQNTKFLSLRNLIICVFIFTIVDFRKRKVCIISLLFRTSTLSVDLVQLLLQW